MYFQAALKLAHFKCESYVHFCMYICSKLYIINIFICSYVFYFSLWPYLCATSYLPVTSMKVLCLSNWANSFIHWSASSVWPFTFIEKFDCHKINLELYVISIVTVLLLVYDLRLITSFLVCQSAWLFDLCEISISEHNGVMSQRLISMGPGDPVKTSSLLLRAN